MEREQGSFHAYLPPSAMIRITLGRFGITIILSRREISRESHVLLCAD